MLFTSSAVILVVSLFSGSFVLGIPVGADELHKGKVYAGAPSNMGIKDGSTKNHPVVVLNHQPNANGHVPVALISHSHPESAKPVDATKYGMPSNKKRVGRDPNNMVEHHVGVGEVHMVHHDHLSHFQKNSDTLKGHVVSGEHFDKLKADINAHSGTHGHTIHRRDFDESAY